MRILQIQGLRALAALLVTIFHARLMPGGFIGVDIFYVISGYLITGLILREIEKTGRLDLNAFYQRRIKRLLPTSVFVLFITAFFAYFILPPTTRSALGRDLFAAATYISNYLFAWWQNDYQNLGSTPSPFIHYWSLAVEEQFYVVWPIFILILSRYGRRVVFNGVAIVTALSLLLSIHQTLTSPIWAFYSLPTRAWELGVGALLLFVPDKYLRNRYFPWIGVLGIIFSSIRFDEGTAFPGFNALLPVVATALLIGTIPIWPRFFNDLSTNRLAQWLGAISYPLYLWHWPALVLPAAALDRPLRIRERLLCILLTIVLAHFTSKYIEQPLRHRVYDTRKVYGFFLATTALSFLVAFFIISTSSDSVKVKGSNYTFNLEQVVRKPAIYGDGCHVNYGDDKSGKCIYGDPSAEKTLVLYGDSHAAQWFPALEQIAKNDGYRLISLTKSACSSVEAPRENKGAYNDAECDRWRKNSIKRIQQLKPYAVVVSSFQRFKMPGGIKNRISWWQDGQRGLLANLQGSSKNLIYISDTPFPKKDIPNCLASQNPQTCDSSRPSPNLIISGFKSIDPTPWLCNQYCPAIQDGYVVYRDASHISVDAALGLTDKLKVALTNKGLMP